MTVEQFGKALVASGLMTADDVKALWTTIPADARPKSAADFGKLFVDKSLLTPFQVAEIIAGRGARLVMGDYTIAAQIGAGGMGQVYKANHRRMKRTVALKVMSSAAMQDEAAVKRFQREVHAAAKLEHPNIVTAYDSGESGNVKYLVMQFVDGGDLSDLVKKSGRLPIEQAVGYVIQAARGLAFAHGEGVIHRDIKPANLLLDKKGVVKILDMGLARFEDGGDGLTATEQVMGTVDYMSPEQAANTKGCDGRADIYSLGCTLWFLLTGKKLYEGDTLIARLMLHRDGPLPSLVKERDDAPWPLEQALHKMIAKRVQDRYQTMDEAIAALAPFGGSAAAGSGAGSSPSISQNADLASFMQAMGTGGGTKTNISATQVKPATSTNVDATAQFTSPEVGTDPKSQVLPKSATTAKPQGAKNKAKSAGNKTKLIAAGALGALLLIAGIIVKIRDKDGNVVAEVNAPTGTNVEVITRPQSGATPIALAIPTNTPNSFTSPVAQILQSPDYVWTPPENLGPPVNGPGDQSLASVTTDQTRIYFARKGRTDGKSDELCEAVRPSLSRPFGEPKVIVPNASEATVSFEGTEIVRGNPELFWLRRTTLDAPFGAAEPVVSSNGRGVERHPTLSPDGLALIFNSSRDQEIEKSNLYICRRQALGQPFGPASKLGPPVNTPGYEHKGFLLADGRTIVYLQEAWYMTSTRSDGMSIAVPLPNHPFDATRDLWISHDGRTAYFSADRPGGFGGNDIYVTRRVPKNGVEPLSIAAAPTTLTIPQLFDSPDYEWSTPEHLGPTINHAGKDGGVSLTADQLMICFDGQGGRREAIRSSTSVPFGTSIGKIFLTEPTLSGDGLSQIGMSSSGGQKDVLTEAFRSTRESKWDFTGPNLCAPADTPLQERSPSLSADGLTLIFRTYIKEEGQDLWIARRTSRQGSFGPAEKLGPHVNTSKVESRGMMLGDGETIVFRREGVWYYTFTNSQGTKASLPLRSNPSFADDTWIAPDGRTAYFSSNLSGGLGAEDIYVTRLVPKSGAATPPSFVTPSGPANVVYLDDLPETEYKDGHMKLGKHNLDYNRSPYTWRGKEPTHALMTHPSKDKAAIVSYRLDGRYETFSVTTGLSDATKENLRSPLIFRVLGDGREIWRSGPVQKLTDEAPASFSVRGVQELRLEVSCGNSNFHAHAVWFEPRLTLASSTNTTTGVPTSPPPAGDYALKFVMSEKVEAPNPQLDESQPFTAEAYLTPGDADLNSMIAERLFGIDGEFHFEIKDSRWRFYSTHNEAMAPERFVPRRRVHVAGVRTTTGRQLYLDGKLVASKDDPLKLASKQSETPLVLEARGAVGVVLDELRISQGVVYDKEFAPPAKLTADKNTLALYHFDEGFGDVLKDSSGKGRDGKISGATWVKADGSPIPATAPAPTTIPAEALTFAGHRYLLVDSFGTWSEAKAKAEAMGGHLATINSKEERTWLLTNIFQKRPRFGDSDRARQVFLGGVIDLTAGPTWKWVTGEPFDESLWLGSKPTDADKSGLSWITDTQWNGLGTDGPGYRSHFFLVEWDTLGPVEASPSPPAAVRWPLAASKPEDIEWLRSLNARLVLRQDAAGDREVRVHDPIPPGPSSIVGIEFSRDSGPAITDQVLARVAGLGDLESLTLNFATPGSAATAEGLKPLAALTNLRKLALGRIGWPKTDPAFLGSFRNLESLELSNITILGWEPHVARLPNLSALTLYGVDDAKLEQLGAMPKLMSLRFAGYQNHHPRRFAAAQPFIAANPWCRVTYVGLDGDNMKQLVVEPTAPPPAGPASQPIATMPAALRWPLAPSKPEDIRWALGLQGKVTLRSDLVGGAPVERVISKPEEIPPGSATIVGVEIYPTDRRTTDADLERIATLVDLETFVFGNQKQAITATSAGLLKLAALVNLRRLDVHHFKNYAAGASGILKAMPRLDYLYPPHSTAAAEEWIGVAATLPSIQELHLFRCDVTDAGLAPVEKMPQLALLDIQDNSKVTLSAIERIAAAVPGCRIRWGTNEDRRTIEPRTASAANAGVENPASVAKWLLDDKKLGRIRVVVDGREQLVTTIPTAPFKVVELDFSPSNNAGKPLSEAEIARLAVFTDLESLELGGQPLTDAGLAGLAGLKKLKKLIVNDTPLTPAAVTTIRQFPQLESLHTFSTDEWLKPLAGMPTIKAMTIYRSAISAQAMSWFPQYPNLSELELHSCFEAPGLRLSEALAPLKECKNLKKLHLNTSKFDTDALAVVSGLSGLIELDLSVSQLTEEQVKQLAAALPRCQVKWKDGANNFKQYIFEPTAPPGEPTTSSTPRASSGGETPTSVVQWLMADKKLNSIVFEIAGKRVGSNQLPTQPFKVVGLNFHPANNAGKPLSATEVARLAALTDLEELILSGQPLTDAALATLAPLKKLKVLDLTDTKLTPAAVATLRQFPQLEKLQSFSTDEWLRALAGMPTIRSLIFHLSAISTEGMKTLSQYPNLSELSFTECRELDDPSSILPAAPLKDCRTLTRLTLTRGSFVPSMLDTLAGLTQLRELVVDGPLTADQIRTLAAALPGCRITYNDAANKKTVVEPTAPPAPQSSAPAATTGKLFMHDPAFAQWLQETKSKAAPEQLEAVSKKLMELNPGFDGKLLDPKRKQPPIVEAGVVTKLSVQCSTLTDLSPLKALSGLKELGLGGAGSAGQVADLSPLEGLPLVWLDLSGPGNKVTDLSPLRAMQLEHLACRDLRELVDITPLAGMPLKHLDLLGTKVVNLSAVKGMPLEVLVLSKEVSDISALQGLRLTHLECHSISDLAPLKGMPLKTLWCDVAKISDYTPLYEFTAIKELRIFSAKDPAAVKAALQKALPNCKLEVK